MSYLSRKSDSEQALSTEKITNPSNFIEARAIPALTHSEAGQMREVEFDKFLRLLRSLDENDWNKPTVCPLWDVRQVAAHLAGWVVAFTSFAAFRRHVDNKSLKPYLQNGMSFLEAMNQLQVDKRANSTPGELMAELAGSGAVANRNCAKLPLLLRMMRAKIPDLGWVRIDYMTDLIGTRDMWMHRLDICQATDKPMELDTTHDGRMIALLMRDMGRQHSAKFKTGRVCYELEGVAGGNYYIGTKSSPYATLRVDALDFAFLAAGRTTATELIAQKRLKVSGDQAMAELALANSNAPI
jgi:uncharacterized protein (TIGR03083 family)